MRDMVAIGLMTALLPGCGGDQAEDAPESSPAAEAPATAEIPDAGLASNLDLPEGVTSTMVARGKTIFEGPGVCLTCHGPTGEGTQIAPNLTDDERLHVDGSYEQLLEIIDTGVQETIEFPGMMMPRGGSGMSDDDLRAVGAYVWSLSHKGG